jgi:RNA polymerase sigma factor (sigma-70 family)
MTMMDPKELVEVPEEFRVGMKVRVFNWSLDRAIRAKGWKRKEAAKACGVSLSTLGCWLAFKSYPKEHKRMEVSIALGVPEEVIFPEGIEGFRIHSQPEPVSFGKEEAMALGLCSQEVDPEQVAIQASLQEALHEVMQRLGEREKLVLKLRFGLEGEESLTLEEVGAIVGVTRSRIRQIEAKALRRLRHPSRSILLRSYVGVDDDKEIP